LAIAITPRVDRWSRRTVVALALAGFVSFKLSEALSGTPLVWQDSLLYEKAAHAGWFSSDLWTGARAPLVPVVWKLTGTPTSYVVVQTCFSILCWAALGLVVARVVPGRWWRVSALVGVLALAITEPVRLWDQSVLSETFALSFLVLLVAALFLLLVRPGWPATITAGVAAFGFAATRDTDIFTTLMLGVAFAVYAVVRRSGLRWRALALAAALVAASAFPLGLLVASGRSDLNVRNNYYVRVFPYPTRVAWFNGHGMPEAPAINALAAARQTPPGQVPIVGPDMNDPSWAPLYAWIRSHGARTYLEWLAVHPGYVFSAPFHRPPESFNNADGKLSFYAGDITSTDWLDRVFSGPWWYAIGIAGAALVVATAGGVTRRREWQLSALLALVGAASVLAAWHGDGQEVTRHTVEADVQVRLALTVALLVALPAWWRRYAGLLSGRLVEV